MESLATSRAYWTLLAAIVGTSVVAGCAASTRTVTVAVTRTVHAKAPVPPPPLARVVPPRYRTTGIWHANLTNARVRDVVVASVGPATGPRGYHHADLQVLSWDGIAGRWVVAFDAADAMGPVAYGYTLSSNVSPGIRTLPSTTMRPILDDADTSIGPVRFAPILLTARRQLVFSATFVAGASGFAGTLVVVDFKRGVANVLYTWYGQGGVTWSIRGSRIHGHANYWPPSGRTASPSRIPTAGYRRSPTRGRGSG
jgi:hypothetical protein